MPLGASCSADVAFAAFLARRGFLAAARLAGFFADFFAAAFLAAGFLLFLAFLERAAGLAADRFLPVFFDFLAFFDFFFAFAISNPPPFFRCALSARFFQISRARMR